jgi:hypothetical protein
MPPGIGRVARRSGDNIKENSMETEIKPGARGPTIVARSVVLALILAACGDQEGPVAPEAASLGLAKLEWSGVVAAIMHSAGYLLATGAIAAVVYERLGLGFLRSAWVNLDLVWAVALVVTGIATVTL